MREPILAEYVLAKALHLSLTRGVRNASPPRIPDPFWTHLETQGRRDDCSSSSPSAALPQFAFSEADPQQSFLSGRFPFGNSIRKAYLCHAQIRDLPAGSPLLFYRSQDRHAVSCIGVAESCLRSSDASLVARFVGKRTVYSLTEIEEQCRKETLAVLFRHSQILDSQISLAELRREGILKAAPQSIVTVPSEAMAWLRNRLER